MKKKEAAKFSYGVFDQKHRANIKKRLKAIDELFDMAAKEGARIGEASGFNDPDKAFSLSDYPEVQKRIDDLMRSVSSGLQGIIETGDREEWLLACEKNDEMVDSVTSSTGLPKAQVSQWKQPNLEALAAFQARKEAGIGLSGRVWRIAEQFKEELELALDLGLGEGKSAATLSRDVRKYLNEPNRLFRRVRDKHGALRLSKAAKAYHPGRGVYRSSYKNALRLTATETNMAYRKSDSERWKQIPFVVGIRISISHNNHPVADICDELQGDYPKDFVWLGWHPFCKCAAVAIRAKQEEFMDYQRRLLAGEDVSNYEFSGTIEDTPGNFKKWMDGNSGRISRHKSAPYFMKDNPKYTGIRPRKNGVGAVTGTKLGRSATKEAFKEYENGNPTALTKEQKAQTAEMAKALGLKTHSAMTFFEADEGRANVNYGKGIAFSENCQCCVAIHEARLRGLNLTAIGYSEGAGSVTVKLGDRFQDIWVNAKTGKTPQVTMLKADTESALFDKLEKAMTAKGRYHVGINFNDNTGHVITAERLESGRLLFYDAQSGDFLNIREYTALESFEVLKVDKLLFNKDLLRAISQVI